MLSRSLVFLEVILPEPPAVSLTVRRGSLVGAHLYLLVKELLETKVCLNLAMSCHFTKGDQADDEITHEDYIELVQRLIAQFCEQTNTVSLRKLRQPGTHEPTAEHVLQYHAEPFQKPPNHVSTESRCLLLTDNTQSGRSCKG